ncbi:nucleotide-binding protein [Ferviditalea candida]|uniref:Nucleotide-binding protein n=1 Tax=Ferviditalea candida TaxID=3108399 RepID=A0ABU5ZNG3_9BACL|nr:nucleotide-binding protein [Paenibacillaceae bacterium T2]
MKPRVFIGSSVESLEIARALQVILDYDCESVIWNQGVFKLSSTTMHDLSRIEDIDFAIFIFSPDDLTTIRNQEYRTVRDNLILEFGMFVGKLGLDRVFFVIPKDIDFHLPTDILGITPGVYEAFRKDKNIEAALGAVSRQMLLQMKQLGNKTLPVVEGKWEFTLNSSNKWIWKRYSGNGKLIGASCNEYVRKEYCIENARLHGYTVSKDYRVPK